MSIHSLGTRPHFRFDSVIVDKGERLGHSLSCGLSKASKGTGVVSLLKFIYLSPTRTRLK